jgi:type III secretion protein U
MSSEKTEEASDQKLTKAREKGQVAKSQDFTQAISMLGVTITLLMLAEDIFTRIRRVFGQTLNLGDGDLPVIELIARMSAMTLEVCFVVFPLVIVAAAFSIIGGVSQIGFMVTMEAVAPKPENIDPAAGIKKVISIKSLMTFGLMVIKAVVLGIVLWKVIIQLLPMVTGAVYQSVPAIGYVAWHAITKILCVGLMLFLMLGPLDFAIQRWQFLTGQRMSKDEVKREQKESEGDPDVKHQRERLAHEIASEPNRQRAVTTANAIIVNPTHYAVALRYDAQTSGLPIIVAKGFDEDALWIREQAQASGVPIFGNPPLARALFKVPLNQPVPEELFGAVAAVLKWVGAIGPAPTQRL